MIQMDINQAKLACVELVTKNGRPFVAVEDSGFQKFVGPIFSKLRTTLDRKKVAAWVSEVAKEEMEKLKASLSGKMVCLKLDLCTRLERSFIGINIQFPEKGQLILQTLAVHEMEERHTSDAIQAKLQSVLQDFGVKKAQIYSATSDNGANVVRALRQSSEELEEEQKSVEDDDDGNIQDIQEVRIEEGDWQLEEAEEEPAEAEAEPQVGIIEKLQGFKIMPCAAHTLQLAVLDFLKEKSIDKVIVTARKLATTLRTQNIRYILKDKAKKPPVLDVKTRWSSCHDMLVSLVELKETCISRVEMNILKKVRFHDTTWTSIEELIQILQPAKLATIAYQDDQLTAGEFHERWTKMKLSVGSIGKPRAQKFLQCIHAREKRLLDNPGVLLAVYVDPRYKTILNEAEVVNARAEVLRVAKSILGLRGTDQQVSHRSSPSQTVTEPQAEQENLEDQAYEKLLEASDKERQEKQNRKDQEELKLTLLKEELLDFEAMPRLVERNLDIFQWWGNQEKKSALFCDVASTILSFPVTQVSVERVFSGLRYIMNDYRGKMTSKTVKDVMFLRLNKKFIY